MLAFVILKNGAELSQSTVECVGHQVPTGYVGVFFFTQADAEAGIEYILENNEEEVSREMLSIRKIAINIF